MSATLRVSDFRDN
jgi:ATP-dependent RNA helicase DHX37/DHR1